MARLIAIPQRRFPPGWRQPSRLWLAEVIEHGSNWLSIHFMLIFLLLIYKIELTKMVAHLSQTSVARAAK